MIAISNVFEHHMSCFDISDVFERHIVFSIDINDISKVGCCTVGMMVWILTRFLVWDCAVLSF